MYLKKTNSNKLARVNKFLVFVGFITTSALLFLVVLVLSNKLMFNIPDITKNYASKFLGYPETSVSSLSDLKGFLHGAAMGFVNGNSLDDIDLQVSQENILRLAADIRNGEGKYLPGILTLESNGVSYPLKGKIRSKGDRKLHRESFNTASIRVNLKGEDRLYGLEEFSIQRPALRGYTWELLSAEVFKSEGLLTLKSVPVNFSFNGDARGIYIAEEVPGARTVERHLRKSGPIFGLDEKFGSNISSVLDVYDKKDWQDSLIYIRAKASLESEFNKAQQGEVFRSDVFDFDEWAKFFALTDFFGVYHGSIPKSVKFYYNPVVGKFQPILFDAHKGAGKFNQFVFMDYKLENPLCEWICDYQVFHKAFLDNEDFFNLYKSYLYKYSDSSFLNSVRDTYNDKFKSLDNLLYSKFSRSDMISYLGYGPYYFKFSNLQNRASLINKRIVRFAQKENSYFKKELNGNDINNGFFSKEYDVLTSEDVSIVASELLFKKPTLWLLKGNNRLLGLENKPMRIKGPVMLVQEGGTLKVNQLELIDGLAIELDDRNWSGALNLINTDFMAKEIIIDSNLSEDAINIVSSKFNINKIEVRNSSSDAIDFDFSEGEVSSVICTNIANDCLDGSESYVKVTRVDAKQVLDKVVSAGENSNFKINSLSISNSGIGLVAKDGSSLSVSSINLRSVELFSAAFIKKPEYSEPKLYIEKVHANNNDLVLLRSSSSTVEVQSSKVREQTLTSGEIESLMYGATYGVATKK